MQPLCHTGPTPTPQDPSQEAGGGFVLSPLLLPTSSFWHSEKCCSSVLQLLVALVRRIRKGHQGTEPRCHMSAPQLAGSGLGRAGPGLCSTRALFPQLYCFSPHQELRGRNRSPLLHGSPQLAGSDLGEGQARSLCWGGSGPPPRCLNTLTTVARSCNMRLPGPSFCGSGNWGDRKGKGPPAMWATSNLLGQVLGGTRLGLHSRGAPFSFPSPHFLQFPAW